MFDYDAYIILNHSDWPFVKKNIPYIKKNLNANNIIIVSSSKILENNLLGCDFLDENTALYKTCGISFESTQNYLIKLGSEEKNTGWYLQQFLKLGISKICKKEYYLVWDADTIPLNKIPFFDENGKPFFNLKKEYYKSYFETINNLFGIKKCIRESFISEHMLFASELVREMLQKIEKNEAYDGEYFWQKILNASNLLKKDLQKKDQRFFSEFETFGTYCAATHKDYYVTRKLRTLRYGVDFLGQDPSDEILEWASNDFDTISFEKWGTPIPESLELIQSEDHRNKMSFADTIRKLFKDGRIRLLKSLPRIDSRAKKYYFDLLLGKTGFDFFFGTIGLYNKNQFFFEFIKKHNLLQKTRVRIQRYWMLLTYSF